MAYTTIKGTCDTAQHQSDFDDAVNAVGGPAVCIGGQSLGPNSTISQAVNADITEGTFASVNMASITVITDLNVAKPKKRRKKAKPKKKR